MFFLLVLIFFNNTSYAMENNNDRRTWQKELASSIIEANHVTLAKLVESPYFSPEMMITNTSYNHLMDQYAELSLLKLLTFSSAPELDVLKIANILCNKSCTIVIPTDMNDTLLSPLSTVQSEKIFTFLVKQIKESENEESYTAVAKKILNSSSAKISIFLNLSTQIIKPTSLIIDLYETYKPNIFYKDQRKNDSEMSIDDSTILHIIMINHCMVIAADNHNKYTHLRNEQKKKMAFFICKGEDPYVKNAMGHTFFDVKNLCVSVIQNEISVFSIFTENPDADKTGFIFGFWLGALQRQVQYLDNDEKNVIIANINNTYSEIEQITNLAAHYALCGSFNDQNTSTKSVTFTEALFKRGKLPTNPLLALQAREYGKFKRT